MTNKKPTKKEIQEARFANFFADRGEDWVSPLEQMELDRQARERVRPSFANVESGFQTTEVDEPQKDEGLFADEGFGKPFQNILDSLSGGVKSSASGVVRAGADPESVPGYTGDVLRSLDSAVDEHLPRVAKYRDSLRAELTDTSDALSESSAKDRKGVQTFIDQQDDGWAKTLYTAESDTAGSPTSLLSPVGGPFAGGIAGTDVYLQEYNNAVRNGLDPKTARERALKLAGIEAGISSIPAGKLLGGVKTWAMKRFGKEAAETLVRDVVKNDSRVILERLAKTAVGEGIEESVTEAAQIGVDADLANRTTDDTTRKFALDNTKNWQEQVLRAGLAGMVGGTAFGGIEGLEVAAEAGRRAADLRDRAKTSIDSRRVNRADLNGKLTSNLFEDVQGPEPVSNPNAIDTEHTAIPSFDQIRKLQLYIPNQQELLTQLQAEREATVKEISGSLSRVGGPRNEAAEQRLAAQDKRIAEVSGRVKLAQNVLRRLGDAGGLGLNIPEQPNRPAYNGDPTTLAPQVAPQPVAAPTAAPAAKPTATQEAPAAPVTGADMLARFDGLAQQERTPATERSATFEIVDRSTGEVVEKANTLQETLDKVQSLGGKDKYSYRASLKQEGEQTTENGLETVYGAMLKRNGSGDVKTLHKLMQDGNVRIVEDERDIPADATAVAGAKGFYDGKTTYIIANKMNKDNVIGDMLSVASHELKHAADASGKLTSKPSLRNFIGNEANKKLVAKIEALAKSDANIADLVRHVKEVAPNAYELELPAYFINEAHDKKSILAGRVLQDAVSAVRVAAKKTLGINDVNLNDVAYLSRALVKEVAVQGKRLTGNTDGLGMIMGTNAKGFSDAHRQGRAYFSKDEKVKFVESDAGSKVIVTKPTLDKLYNNEPVKLSDVLDHPTLYRNYPHLADVKIKLDRDTDADAYYLNNTIGLSTSEYVNFAYALQEKKGLPAASKQLRDLLLHEVQHAVQDYEGHARGGNVDEFKTNEDKQVSRDLDYRMKALEADIQNIARPDSLVALAPTAQALVRASARAHEADEISLLDHAQDIVDALKRGTSDGKPLSFKVRMLENSIQKVKDLQAKNREIEDRAYKQYQALHGETEARYTQRNADITQSELDSNPEDPNAFFGFDVPSNKTDVRFGQGQVQGSISSDNFKKWFGNSKAVDTEGNPMVFYTGTSKDVEFTGFKINKNGAWFTDDPAGASQYAVENDSMGMKLDDRPGAKPWTMVEINTKSRVFPVYLKIENPYYMTDEDSDTIQKNSGRDGMNYKRGQGIFFDGLRSKGYDAAVWANKDGTFNTVSIIGSPGQIKSTMNHGNYNPNKPDVLAFKPRDYRVGARSKEFGRILERLLVPGGFIDSSLKELMLHASHLPASLMAKATKLGNDMLDAIDRNAMAAAGVKTGDAFKKARQKLRVDLGKELERIDQLPTRAERNAALDALDRNPRFKDIGAAVRKLRDFKMDLTRQILVLRAADPRPMTEKEQAVYNKMIENAERYTTRAYLATYRSDIGYQYGKNLLKRFKQNPDSLEGRIVQRALDYLISKELVVPPLEDLHKLGNAQLRRMYENWIGGAEEFKGDEGRRKLIDALNAIPQKTKDEIDAKAMEIVKDMLGQNKSKGTSARFYSIGAKQNRTILETRTDIPEELRALMGEITDPFLREAISLQRMINLQAKTKLLTEVFEQGKDKGWWTDQKTEDNEVQLKDVSYGPMNGKWINRDLVDALTGNLISLESTDKMLADAVHNPTALSQWLAGKSVRMLTAASRIQKTYRIVFSLAQMVFNFGGAFLNIGLNGVTNPATMYKGMHDAFLVLASEINNRVLTDKTLPTIQEVIRAGVVDSATVGEFKSQAYQKITEQIEKLNPDQPGYGALVMKELWNWVMASGSVHNAVRQAYAFMDVWTKVATYHDRKNFLTEFGKAEGKNWSEEYVQRRAGFEASGTNISYERAIPLAKIIEKNLPIGMFLTYFSEVPRTVATSFLQVAMDAKMAQQAKTPEGRRLASVKATTRFIGTATVTGGLIATMSALLDGEDDDEKKRRRLLAPWVQGKWMVPLGLDKNGNTVYFEVNRVDPNGPLNEAIISVITAPEDKKAEALFNAVKGLFVPAKGAIGLFRAPWDMLVETAARLSGSETVRDADMKAPRTVWERNNPVAFTRFKRWLSYGDLGENLVAAAEIMWTPASIQPLIDDKGRIEKPAHGEIDKVPNALGYRAYVADPEEGFMFRVKAYEDAMKQLNREKASLLRDADKLDSETIVSNLSDLKSRELEAFNELRLDYEGYLAYGKTLTDATRHFDNKKLFAQIRYNRFDSRITDTKPLASWAKQQIKEGRDPQEVRQVLHLLVRSYTDADKESK